MNFRHFEPKQRMRKSKCATDRSQFKNYTYGLLKCTNFILFNFFFNLSFKSKLIFCDFYPQFFLNFFWFFFYFLFPWWVCTFEFWRFVIAKESLDFLSVVGTLEISGLLSSKKGKETLNFFSTSWEKSFCAKLEQILLSILENVSLEVNKRYPSVSGCSSCCRAITTLKLK